MKYGLIIAILLFANPAFAKGINPFGKIKWTEIGNVPISPNSPLGSPMLHLTAIDLFQERGTWVYSADSGTAKKLKGRGFTAWTTTIQVLAADGTLTYYMHLDPEMIPNTLRAAFDENKTIEVKKGDLLGALIKGPGAMPSHLHFGMADCTHRRRLNPLKYLDYEDTQAPVIDQIIMDSTGIWNLGKKILFFKNDLVTGKVDLTIFAYDQIDGQSRIYPPNSVKFKIESLSSTKVRSIQHLVYDASSIPFKHPVPGSKLNLACEDFFEFDGYDVNTARTLYRWKLIGMKEAKGLPISLTETTDHLLPGMQAWLKPHSGPWNTAECDSLGVRKYPDGNYRITVTAADAQGNRTIKTKDFEVQNSRCQN